MADKPEGDERILTRRGALFVAAVAVVVLVVLVGVPLWNQHVSEERLEETRYNGFDFYEARQGNRTLWKTELTVEGQPYDIPFYYHPRDVERIPIEPGIAEQLREEPPATLYMALSPEAGSRPVVAAVEVSRITGERYNLLNIPTKSALKSGNPNATTRVRTCADATPEAMVISFDEGDENAVYRDENPFCIRLEYTSGEESIRVADRLAYELVQIM